MEPNIPDYSIMISINLEFSFVNILCKSAGGGLPGSKGIWQPLLVQNF